MPAPAKLDRIVNLFAGAPKDLRVQALLEYSRKLPPLPPSFDSSELEKVPECATPFFVATELDDDKKVHLHFDVPAEAPTTRGYAGVLQEGFEGSPAQDVLDTPADFYERMGLAEAISSQRLRGMGAILARIKRQVREQLDAGTGAGAAAG